VKVLLPTRSIESTFVSMPPTTNSVLRAMLLAVMFNLKWNKDTAQLFLAEADMLSAVQRWKKGPTVPDDDLKKWIAKIARVPTNVLQTNWLGRLGVFRCGSPAVVCCGCEEWAG